MLRLIGQQADIDLSVFYLSDFSTRAYQDKEFGVDVTWDTDLTSGINHTVIRSNKSADEVSFFNPKVTVKDLFKQLDRQKWDAIWVHGYANMGLMASIVYARLRSIPIFLRGENNLTCSPSNWKKDVLMRWLIRNASALLYIGSANRSYYEAFGARPTQLFSMPYAVDNTFFQNPKPSEEPHLSSATAPVKFLYASKLTPRKNARLLVAALAQLPIALRDQAKLTIVGDGEERTALTQDVQALQLGSHIEILGFQNQSDMARHLQDCDVFVLPSQKEPFGLVINEAMNAGKAILTTNEVGCAVDLVAPGVNGWVVKAGCLGSLVSAMQDAIEHRSQLALMGEASLARINQWSFAEDVIGLRAALERLN